MKTFIGTVFFLISPLTCGVVMYIPLAWLVGDNDTTAWIAIIYIAVWLLLFAIWYDNSEYQDATRKFLING